MKKLIPLYLGMMVSIMAWAQPTPGPINQLIIDDSYNIDMMVTDFFSANGCAQILNISYSGVQSSATDSISNIGFFDGAGTDLGLPAGMVFSTGNIHDLSVLNSGTTSTNLSYPGDTDLDALITTSTYDAAVLEFDAVAAGDSINFSYVFGSEEFPEFIGSSFNDVFAFFVQGPNDPEPINIAVLPDGLDTPVSINSVGNVAPYYVDNTNGQFIGMDGFTIPMTASFTTTPGATYHIKIAIADAGDGILDSSVFLGIESMCGDTVLRMPGDFVIVPDQGNDLIFTFENNVRYAYEYYWEFGDGNTSLEKNPTHTYAQGGTYTVRLHAYNYCCEDIYEQQINITSTSNEIIAGYSPIQIFPNPVETHLSIQTQSEAVISITDMSGRLVLESIIYEDTMLDLEALSTGMYLFKAKIDGQNYIQKINKI